MIITPHDKPLTIGYWYTYRGYEFLDFHKDMFQFYLVEEEEHGNFFCEFNACKDEAYAHFAQYLDPIMKSRKKIRRSRAPRRPEDPIHPNPTGKGGFKKHETNNDGL